MGQPLRPSQFILTYGVGSIIEAPKGPRIIPVFNRWDLAYRIFSGSGDELANYEIMDRNASAQLNEGQIFAIPTNPSFELPVTKPLFRTFRFPKWGLCQRHRILYPFGNRGRSSCPQCRDGVDKQYEAIRFVRACPNGHLDDVNWPHMVHGAKECDCKLFVWDERLGSDLKSVRIKCRKCGAEISLSDIYHRTYSCSGYFPEEDCYEECDEKASVMLRNATSLRVAETVTSITIPPPALNIHRILSRPTIGKPLLCLVIKKDRPKEALLGFLRELAENPSSGIDPATISAIDKTPEGELRQAIADLLEPHETKTADEVKEEEFRALSAAAVNGYPPYPSEKPMFEIERDTWMRYEHASGISFRVTPVKRLRVVIVQRGYRRPVRGFAGGEGKRPPKLIERYYEINNKRWYPGVALYGEGIFIDFPDGIPAMDPQRAKTLTDLQEKDNTSGRLVDPFFIWLHTLSHRIINGLSVYSGYSSASIRERIYFSNGSGGMLLYSCQEGSDGTLGGLIAMCNESEFKRVMEEAEINLSACSNDPLCAEHLGHNNGAACYACLLVPETSCEFHNEYLDRIILARTLQG